MHLRSLANNISKVEARKEVSVLIYQLTFCKHVKSRQGRAQLLQQMVLGKHNIHI